VGTLFLLDNLGYVNSEYLFENFWPLILVLIGVLLLFRRSYRAPRIGGISEKTATAFPESDSDFLVRSALVGNIEVKVTSKNFSGGSCSVVFGNIGMVLREAQPQIGQSTLKLNGVFGSIRVEAPADIAIAVNSTLVAGHIEVNDQKKSGLFETIVFKSPGFDTAQRKLIVQASQMFGNISVLVV
jgi:predicted membrane protein